MQNQNLWGAQNSGIDQQRQDLFKVIINLPASVGGQSAWTEDVEFAVESFPFPNREREMVGVKYMNQTNFMLGADTASGAIEIPVRYAFNQPTAQRLEKWNYLTSNPRTGGVGLTTKVKAWGEFWWMVPNMAVQENVESERPSDASLVPGLIYHLEGCLIKGLKFSEASMTGNGMVNMTFTMQIDRYYPKSISNMVVKTQ